MCCWREIFCLISGSTQIISFFNKMAPAHRAKETVELLKTATQWLSWLYSANVVAACFDINPVDYKIWGTLQEWVYRTRIKDVDELRHHGAAHQHPWSVPPLHCGWMGWAGAERHWQGSWTVATKTLGLYCCRWRTFWAPTVKIHIFC